MCKTFRTYKDVNAEIVKNTVIFVPKLFNDQMVLDLSTGTQTIMTERQYCLLKIEPVCACGNDLVTEEEKAAHRCEKHLFADIVKDTEIQYLRDVIAYWTDLP